MFKEPETLPRPILPNTRILLATQEYIGEDVLLEGGVGGFIQLRSTFARLGFISPPTFADPGFQGQLTMELYNGSNHAITLSPGEAIWSLIRIPVMGEGLYSGRYQSQSGIQIPKALTPIDALEAGHADDLHVTT